jgi:CRP-like cAMP-binding protein
MELLKNYFLSQGFNDQESQFVADKFHERNLKKRDHFVEEGKTSNYLGFIENGFLQYYINLDGEEKTTYSIGANNFVASLVSFLKQVPSIENIRAVMDTTVWVIERSVLQELQKTIPAFNAFYIGILEWQICCIDESRLDAIMLTAQHRYEKMIKKEPHLIRQIPLQYLASMLGVTPRHLSRIRNNIH